MKKILIVDDNKDIRENLVELIETLGYHVDSAESGIEGLQKYKDDQFDMVFTDIYMPGMDGIDFLNEVKKINKNAVVVVMTAYPSSDTIRETIIGEGYTYVEKPVIFKKIEKLLENGMNKDGS